MARPEAFEDIEVSNVLYADIQLDHISMDPVLLKGYASLLAAAQTAGSIIDSSYSRVQFFRTPTHAELTQQLTNAQTAWDHGKKCYAQLATVGECERPWERGTAERWADKEGLPFPPEHEPITSFDAVIRDIDEVVA